MYSALQCPNKSVECLSEQFLHYYEITKDRFVTDSPKLTYLITGTQYGGATIGMVRLLSGLDPEEFDITVVAIAETEKGIVRKIPDHVTFKRLGVSKKYSVHRLLPLINIFRNTDILVCSGFHAAAVGGPLGRVLRVPQILVWQHNTNYQSRLREGIFGRCYQLSDLVLADSEAVQNMLQRQFNISARKISVLPIAGVDTTRFALSNKTHSEQSGEQIDVVTIGRLVEQKGYFDLIKCAERLGNEFHFQVIGTGELREELEQEAPENVTFLGHVDDEVLLETLTSGDIYFQPSKHEGLCMTVIEAMSCGLPIVGSSVGGITESVVPGETGYLCEAGDIDCFCDNLWTLAENEQLRDNMGVAGRDRIIGEYSQSALAEEFRAAVQKAKAI